MDGGDPVDVIDLSIQDQGDMQTEVQMQEIACGDYGGSCAICLSEMHLQDTALVKGCEHAYCVTCILRWASYSQKPTCPQCKHPFEFLDVHRMLDGSIRDYMFEESVCLLLRASWFEPLIVEDREKFYDDREEPFPSEYLEDFYPFEDEDEDVYFSGSSGLRIGNRRWGDNGYVRAGRQEARPAYRSHNHDSGDAGSSRESKKKETTKDTKDKTGRRAKRALKR